MAIGDKILAARPRAESNERLDLVDWSTMATTAQVFLQAAVRALVSSPKATAGSPTGERWTGSITANPTTGTDGLLRVDSAVFVGVDADGGLVLKPNGTALSVSIPAGGAQQQVYLYMADVAENTQVRRKLPATAPFTEFAVAINTALRQTASLYVRAGGPGSVVAQDAIGTSTYALLFLGIATNTAGVVAFTPAANMLETVTAPATVPSTNTGTTAGSTTVTGSQSTMRELINAALYQIGQIAWKGSAFLTPSAANNYGAYSTPAGGVDKAYRNTHGYITIGNGTTVFGDFDLSAYANANALLTAAIAALPAEGGKIIIKPGVTLSGFASTTVTLPAKNVEIRGDHKNVPSTSPTITFGVGEGFTCSATGSLKLRDLHIQHAGVAVTLTTSPCTVRDVFFENTATVDNGAALQGVNVTDLTVIDTRFYSNLTTVTSNATGIRITGTAYRVSTSRIYHEVRGLQAGTIDLQDMRSNIRLQDTTCMMTYGGALVTNSHPVIKLATNDNTNANEVGGRLIDGVYVEGDSTFVPVDYTNLAYLTITHVMAKRCRQGIISSTGQGGGVGYVRISDCDLGFSGLVGAGVAINTVGSVDLYINNCRFDGPIQIGDGTGVTQVHMTNCDFNGVISSTINGSSNVRVVVSNCTWRGTMVNAGAADFALLTITGGTSIDWVSIVDNHIEGLQNTTYTGADATTNPRLFDVRSPSLNVVTCSRNVVTGVMAATAGNTIKGAYLLRIDTPDGATNATALGERITMHGNQIGQSINGSQVDCCMLLLLQHHVPYDIDISGNNVTIAWDSRANHVQMTNIVHIDYNNTFTGHARIFNFSNNSFDIKNVDSSNITKNVMYIRMAGGASLDTAALNDNRTANNSLIANTFDMVNAYGYQYGQGVNIVSFACIGNSNSLVGNTAGQFIATRFDAAAPLVAAPATPVTGADWTSNAQLMNK